MQLNQNLNLLQHRLYLIFLILLFDNLLNMEQHRKKYFWNALHSLLLRLFFNR